MADKQERTEEASPRKREEARQEGQLARSQEIPMAMGLLAALLSLRIGAKAMLETFERITQFYLRIMGQWAGEDISIVRVQRMTGNGFEFLVQLMAPLFIALFVTGIASNMIQTGPFIGFKPLQPKLSRISLARGFGALFSQRSIAETMKSLVKVSVLSILAWRIIASQLRDLMSLPQAGWEPVLGVMVGLVYRLALMMVVVFIILALADLLYQRWQYSQNLKMSKEEVKEEVKQYEGDPQVKARIRSIQRDLARRRMMKDVPKASVVITNPHEIAVALQYERETMNAPKVVAKGERLIAAKIKEIARANNVPVVEDRPLARALFKETPLGSEVASHFYKAIAEILAYVYRMRRPRRALEPRPEPRPAPSPQAAAGGS
ncbi:flagellar biosynthesis protein FlhB [Candidatus Poribacteria bacterium]|nr:flagellar biosynthesis protein FlhB [Candidatus Poribacteria bacterium]